MTARALPYPAPSSAAQYAADLDTALGAPSPIPPNELAVTAAWVGAESPSFPGFNGLGTELDLPGAAPDPSNPQVYDYPNLQEGLAAAVDMMEGLSPQSTALAPQFVADIQSGKASEQQLTADVLASGWAGLGQPDTYDATTIAAELNPPNTASTIETTSFWSDVEGAVEGAAKGAADFQKGDFVGGVGAAASGDAGAAGSAASGILGNLSLSSSAKTFVLTALAAVAGGGLVILGVYKAAGGGRNGHPLLDSAGKAATAAAAA